MEFWLSVLIGILALVCLGLLWHIFWMRRSLREITAELTEKLGADTNTLLSISSSDAAVRALAANLNAQLRALRRERRRLQSGDRELREAVTNISHDLRTPLTAICGYLELLEQEPKSETAARYLELIRNRAEAMKQLTEELFRYSVILSEEQALTMEPVSLNGALEESLADFYAALAQRGITPEISIPEMPVVRQLDRAALSRILGNVLSNALKYSDGDLSVTLLDTGELIFANTASALDEVQVGRLFDRFYSVESARNSTGLGLSISKLLTERMDGTITADFERPKFRIRLIFPEKQNPGA